MATYRRRGTSWQVQVRRLGHQPVSRSYKTKADAELWARGIESQIDRGDLPRNHRDLGSTRLADLLTRYRDTITPRKRSRHKEACRINRILKSSLAVLTLNRVTPATLAQFRDKRLSTVGAQAVRHDLNLLHHMFKIAMQEWDVPLTRNPVSGIRKPPQPRARERRLIDGEFDRLQSTAKSLGYGTAAAIISFAVETGMRKAEILLMQWDHLDQDRRLLHIPETKNGLPRTIPLSARAAELIRSMRGTDDQRVFAVSVPWLRYAWDQIVSVAGMSDLHFHDLRHEAISRFFEKGLSVPEVALISGHRDVRQLFRYTHLRAEDVAKKLT